MLAVIPCRVGVTILSLPFLFIGCSSLPVVTDVQVSVHEAESTLAAVQNAFEVTSFYDSMKVAKAIFIVTPNRARGVMLARDEATRTWSGPAFYTVTRLDPSGGRVGTYGFSVGKQDLELVALAMTGKAVNWFLSPSLPVKGVLKIVAGNEESAHGKADIVMFEHSRTSGREDDFKGTAVTIDQTANQAYYGRPVTPADILVRHSASNPDAAPLQKAVAKTAD